MFVCTFSDPWVLEVYADYINNFNKAMDVVKSESDRKSVFADFLQIKQLNNMDRSFHKFF